MSNNQRQTFKSTFFEKCEQDVTIPDYQRSYAWEKQQIDLFIKDMVYYKDRKTDYYFGHFISEEVDPSHPLEIVDGQQRLTTFVLFLIICRHIKPELELPADEPNAYQLIQRFSTVPYDKPFFKAIQDKDLLTALLGIPDKDLNDTTITKALGHTTNEQPNHVTQSQKRMAIALRQFFQAFKNSGTKPSLDENHIADYIGIIMESACSHHVAKRKSVAVNIFEMHNTRGVALTTIEIVKAKLMKFVYDNGANDEEKRKQVEKIQEHFGEIYALESRLEESSFREDLSLEQVLRLHLRVIDDGEKLTEKDFNEPALNANSDKLIKYIDEKLHNHDSKEESSSSRIDYAKNLAREFQKSVEFISTNLTEWDKDDHLVGDTIIQEKQLSYQFFLLLSRKDSNSPDHETLELWEKLLFSRDFHDEYRGLRYRDNFPRLFEEVLSDRSKTKEILKKYLKDGFRPKYRTKDLQDKAQACINDNTDQILNKAYDWWRKNKMIYAIYKYEISKGAKIEALRKVMRGTFEREHILPRQWHPEWISGISEDNEERDRLKERINNCIDGIGNLLLITSSENASLSDSHPKDKKYDTEYGGGTYAYHNEHSNKWEKPENWCDEILSRGKSIKQFILNQLLYK